MVGTRAPKSKRERALELCRELLDDLDHEKVAAPTALSRLRRIASLINQTEVAKRANDEINGYLYLGDSIDEVKTVLKQFVKQGKLKKDLDIDATAKELFAPLPEYRRLLLSRLHGTGFKKANMIESISKYQELLERIRKDTKTEYDYHQDDGTVKLNAADLNKLVSGAIQWVYIEASKIEETIEFGKIPLAAMESTFKFVDSQLFEMIPKAAERLIIAYRNLAEKNKENWVNVVDTCRRVIKDFANVIFPPRNKEVHGLAVTEDKYLNRIRAFIKETIRSPRQKQHLEAVLELIGEILSRTDNLASRSVHSGEVSRYEAERILIYTYLCIGDILVLSKYKSHPDLRK